MFMDHIFPTTIIYLLLFLSTLFYYHFSKQKPRKHKLIAKLPPGSMGWPYIGETLQLYYKDPNIFFLDKQKRYGEIFKTHILGCPCVMLASPEAAKFVLVTNADLFKPTYPRSKEKMIGPAALFFHQGEYHSQLRRLVQSSFSPEAVKKLIPGIESVAASTLESWADGRRIISTFQGMKKFSFEVGILAIFGHLERRYKEELKKNYSIVDRGYNSFPTNLPGTAYYKALSARKRLNQILQEIICERKEKKLLDNNLVGHLLNFKNDKGQTLRADQIADNIIGVLFAAQDTTASALTWILKYLHDDPKLFEAVAAEQKEIYLSNEKGNRSLTWTQTRSMPFTYKVIMESLRMASIVSFTFREAVVDVVYNGYLIPKGWKVMPLFRNIHHNPEFYNEPQKFDPYRFEAAPRPNTFLPFGTGAHSCPGNELAKLEILIMIHHLINKFRWKVVGPQDMVEYSPFPVPHNGLPARFWKEPENVEEEAQI